MDIYKCHGTDCPVRDLCAHFLVATDGLVTVMDTVPWDGAAEYCDEFITAEKDLRVPVKVPWRN
jgi:hypothetical protein